MWIYDNVWLNRRFTSFVNTTTNPIHGLGEASMVVKKNGLTLRIAEQSVPVPGPSAKEGIAGVAQGLPPEHDQRRISEQSVHFPVPPIELSSVPSVPTMFPAKWRMKRAKTWSPPGIDQKGACWKSENLAEARC